MTAAPIFKRWPRDPRYIAGSNGTITGPRGFVLSTFPDKDGYLRFNAYYGKPEPRWMQYAVHVAVAETFIGPRPEGLVIRHLDGDFTNAAWSNLEYGTYEQNEADKLDHDRRAWGVRHGMHKLTEDEVRTIRASSESHAEMSRIYGVGADHVMHIRQRKCWRHI